MNATNYRRSCLEKVGLLAIVLGNCSVVATGPARIFAHTVTVKGHVERVTKSIREIKINLADGRSVNLKISLDVAWLNDLKKDDLMEVAYLEPVALSLKKAATRAALVAETVDVTPVGSGLTRHVTVNVEAMKATVLAVDREKRTVTLRAPDGDKLRIAAGLELTDFDQLTTGDYILAQYTQPVVFEMHRL